jgi:hypothetical protein
MQTQKLVYRRRPNVTAFRQPIALFCLMLFPSALTAAPQHASPLQRNSLSVGVGYAGSITDGNGEQREGMLFRVGLGQRIADRVHIIEDVGAEFPLVSGGVLPRAAQYADLGVGIRLALLEPQPRESFFTRSFDPNALALELLAGVSMRDTTSTKTSEEVGPMLSGALSYLPSQGADYAFGIEVRAQMCVMNADVAASFDLLFLVQLAL